MIDRQEILEFAGEVGLDPNVVEKDYVLGWILAGISQHPHTRDSWLFKGGTCLKKCYFETYRFSEDLDFTLLDGSHLDEGFLRATFTEIAQWVYDESGVELPEAALVFERYDNPRGKPSAQGRVGYRGPMRRQGDPPRIRLDLTDDERVVRGGERRPVHHPYSDAPDGGIHVLSYCFEEVFAEKFRALAERERPRDLYDVIHLHRHDTGADRAAVLEILTSKCEFKGIPVPTLESLRGSPHHAALRADWEQMLAHQLPQLPPFGAFWDELPAVFDWLDRSLCRYSRRLCAPAELKSTRPGARPRWPVPGAPKVLPRHWKLSGLPPRTGFVSISSIRTKKAGSPHERSNPIPCAGQSQAIYSYMQSGARMVRIALTALIAFAARARRSKPSLHATWWSSAPPVRFTRLRLPAARPCVRRPRSRRGAPRRPGRLARHDTCFNAATAIRNSNVRSTIPR